MRAARLPVLVASGHPGTRAALYALLDGDPALSHAASTADLASTVRALACLGAAVVVVDQRILGEGGLDGLPPLVALAPPAVVLMVGMEDHPRYARRVRAGGAAAYIRLEEAVERLSAAAREAVSAGSGDR
jgi:DNA-binding NarL/FixJ family response regulator